MGEKNEFIQNINSKPQIRDFGEASVLWFFYSPSSAQKKRVKVVLHCSLGSISVQYFNSVLTMRNTIHEYFT